MVIENKKTFICIIHFIGKPWNLFTLLNVFHIDLLHLYVFGYLAYFNCVLDQLGCCCRFGIVVCASELPIPPANRNHRLARRASPINYHRTTQYGDCGEGQETADTCKACQPFLPLSSTVLFGRFAPTKCPHRTPQKTDKVWGRVSECESQHKYYTTILITSCFLGCPRLIFYAFYDILENLIGFHHFGWNSSDFPTGKARKSGWLYFQFRPILPPQ